MPKESLVPQKNKAKRKARRSTWPKCPTCPGKIGILYFPNVRTCWVFCCGCNYRVVNEDMANYVEKTLFRGLHRTSDRKETV